MIWLVLAWHLNLFSLAFMDDNTFYQLHYLWLNERHYRVQLKTSVEYPFDFSKWSFTKTDRSVSKWWNDSYDFQRPNASRNFYHPQINGFTPTSTHPLPPTVQPFGSWITFPIGNRPRCVPVISVCIEGKPCLNVWDQLSSLSVNMSLTGLTFYTSKF